MMCDAPSVLVLLHRVEVGDDADVSEVHPSTRNNSEVESTPIINNSETLKSTSISALELKTLWQNSGKYMYRLLQR